MYYWPFLSVEFLGGENHFNPLSETRHIREDAITVDSVAVEQEDTASRFLREENFGLWRGMVSPTKQFSCLPTPIRERFLLRHSLPLLHC